MTRRRHGVDLVDPHHMDILRRDFAERETCDFCPTPLSSGKAFILTVSDGKKTREFQAGPDCAAAMGKTDPWKAPDYTRGALSLNARERRPSGRWLIPSNLSFDPEKMTADELQADIEYLGLRGEKLPALGFKTEGRGVEQREAQTIAYVLAAFKADPNTGELVHIRRLRENAAVYDPRNSHQTLESCYATARMIDRCVTGGKVDCNEAWWLRQKRGDLVREHALPVEDVDQLNRLVERGVGRQSVLKNTSLVLPELQIVMKFGQGGLEV